MAAIKLQDLRMDRELYFPAAHSVKNIVVIYHVHYISCNRLI